MASNTTKVMCRQAEKENAMIAGTVSTEKITDKVRKLLALSKSPNEAEAKAALVKAKALMAEYKLSEKDVADLRKQEVVKIYTSVTFSGRRDAWLSTLAHIICENMCCSSLLLRRKRTYTIGVVGLEDDAQMAAEVFGYAAAYVLEHNREMTRRMKKEGFKTREINEHKLGYGLGFAFGLQASYEGAGSEEWGLVLQIPQEVHEHMNQYPSRQIQFRREYDGKAWGNGFADGRAYKAPAGAIAADGA